jgi:rare lipoprotein A
LYSISTFARAPRAPRFAAAVVLAFAAVAVSVADAEAGSSRARTHRAAKSAAQPAGPFSFFDLFKAPAETKAVAKARPDKHRAHAARTAAPAAATTVAAATASGASTGAGIGGATGIASFYGREHHGGPTASGERFNMHALTAAHRTAPLGSSMRVTNLNNGRSVVVRINDRGPFVRGRIIDVSRGAAEELGFTGAGLAKVRVERMS